MKHRLMYNLSPLFSMWQKTIEKEVRFQGKALQTGQDVRVALKAAGPGQGITFVRTDLEGAPELRLSEAFFSDGPERRTTIGAGPIQIQTIEHFFAALWALGIDTIMVELDGSEMPGMDGSAAGFLCVLKEAGTKELSEDKAVIRIQEEETVAEGDASISVFPDEAFSVSYSIDYPVSSIPCETFTFTPEEMSFEEEIAPSRTFCMKAEAEMLLKAGLGKGASLENTLVMDEDGPIGNTLRFPNEPVRHKVLDLIGDLYMLGCPVAGRIVAEKSGHKLNSMLVRRLAEKYLT